MRRIFAVLFFTLSYFFCQAACAVDSSSGPIIRFGVFYFYPPFIYSTSVGFGVNMAQALCQQMQARCEFINYNPSEIFTALEDGKIDAIVSAISITAERQKHYLFTKPYYSSTMSFLSQDPRATRPTFDELAKKKIGVLKNSVFEQFLNDAFPDDSKIKPYPRNSELLLALVNHKVDYIVMDTPVAQYWQKRSNCKLHMVGQPVVIPGDQGYGIVLRHDNVALQSLLNDALDKVKQNGQLDQIINMYFGKIDTPDCSASLAAQKPNGALTRIRQFLSRLT